MRVKPRKPAAAARPARRRPVKCRICLEPESFTPGPTKNLPPVSSLKDGVCRDREACQKRQPTLEGM